MTENRDLYAAPVADSEPVSVPEGWQLVPIEPSTNMLAAYHTSKRKAKYVQEIWTALLDAAPQPNPSKVDVVGRDDV
jgi:hypothetical protein